MIRKYVIEAVQAAFAGQNLKGYRGRVFLMQTSRKWSVL